MGLTLHRGDIVFVDLGEVGKSVKGHEQAKKRPCVVVKPMNKLKLAIVLPLTTSHSLKGTSGLIRLTKGMGNLDKDSIVLCQQIRSISHQRVLSRIGQLSTRQFQKIEWGLADFLALV